MPASITSKDSPSKSWLLAHTYGISWFDLKLDTFQVVCEYRRRLLIKAWHLQKPSDEMLARAKRVISEADDDNRYTHYLSQMQVFAYYSGNIVVTLPGNGVLADYMRERLRRTAPLCLMKVVSVDPWNLWWPIPATFFFLHGPALMRHKLC